MQDKVAGTVTRYPPTYRQDELRLIYDMALLGQSVCFVGTAGIGKSNLVRYLRDRIHVDRYLSTDLIGRIHFVDVNAIVWEGRGDHLWQLMYQGLLRATRNVTLPSVENSSLTGSEGDVLSLLKMRLEVLCQHLQNQVMFILDDFDQVIAKGPLPLLEQLSDFRSGGNRDRLGYLIITKKLPHVLGRDHGVENSNFYKLFRNYVFALEPHNDRDALQMLQYLNSRAPKPIEEGYLRQILALAGGHAGLIKAVFDLWCVEGKPATSNLVAYYADKQNVQMECRRILHGLHRQEQEAAIAVARGQQKPEHADTIVHLARRGLLTNLTNFEWFSPLMARFLSAYGAPGDE
jgi:hypothetical protein